MKLFVLGHPSHYGGAGSELHHQICLWRKMFDLEIVIIPSQKGFHNEPLRKEMIDMGVRYTERERDYSTVTSSDAVINFCGKEFFEDLDQILEKTRRTIFVNCMTWLFPKEIEAHKQDKIAFSLYQRPQVRDDHRKKLGSKAQFLHFSPYFDPKNFPYRGERHNDRFTLGRISRQDADKFSRDTFHIWEYAVSPTMKRGIVLGWDQRSKQKTGDPPDWVERHHDQKSLSVSDFYKQVDALVQSTDTNENWPRIGFEAMYSGVPLVVDDKGGWKYMIEHGVTGFRCKHSRDFIYWTSRLAYEPELREQIRTNAYQKALKLSSQEVAHESWNNVFEKVFS